MRTFDNDDLMSEFNHKGIKCQLFWDGKNNGNQCQFSYITSYKGIELLKGTDLFIPVSIAPPDTYKAMISYLSWVIVRDGDTDKDFFKDYSPEALDFVNNNSDLEEVRLFVNDFEAGEKQYTKKAENWLKKRIKTTY